MSNRIKVLHMGNPTGLYGAERWILAVLKHLPQDSVESLVGVIADDPEVDVADLCVFAEKLGVRTTQFVSPGRLSFSAIGKLRRYIVDNDIDILHTHGYKTDIIGLFATRKTKCLNLSTPHGWSVNAGIKLQLYEFLDKIAFYFMDAVVPLSPDLMNGLMRWPGLKRNVTLIQNGVDLDEIDEALELATAVAPESKREMIKIGYIGQLIPRKGIDTLIRAFKKLEVSEKELTIIGSGPQGPVLEALSVDLGVQESVKFLGYREDRIQLLVDFDVFVLPSSLEGIPRCVMEAMGAGIASITTSIPGCVELVKDKETGLLFEVGDVDGLTAALQSMASDIELRSELANSGQQLVRTKYSARAMARNYAELYFEIVEQRRIQESL